MDAPTNKKIKTMTIFGTRPEVIKLAPVIHAMGDSPHFDSILVTTGQHRDMLAQAMNHFQIKPHFNLDIMQPDQGISDVTIDSLRGVEKLIAATKPDLVLVQGDTTSAFAGCLAAFYQQTAVGHVEAGLRTYDKYRPFPEEINRSLITQLADYHFVPTQTAWESLRREGITEDRIFITGNTVIDALFQIVQPEYRFDNEILSELGNDGKRLIVVTSHRRESFGQPIKDVCRGISELVRRFPDIEVVFSVHRNPKVRVPVETLLGDQERVHLVEPLGYADMANLLARCYMVITDSGGIQEEAPALAKPVLILRDVTERPEAVFAGLAKVIGTSHRAIVAAAMELLTDSAAYESMAQGYSPYGDGEASGRIVQAIEFVNGLTVERPAPFISEVASMIAADTRASLEQPMSDELFYRQLDERIDRARQQRQKVSVATFNLENFDNERFVEAVRGITRSLRETDTAAALEGRRLVLVLPGAGEQQARRATDRIMDNLEIPLSDADGALDIEIKTYNGDDKTREDSVNLQTGSSPLANVTTAESDE